MRIKPFTVAFTIVLVAATACRPADNAPPEATPTPTPAATAAATCQDIDRYWNNDWPALIHVLEELRAAEVTCGEQPLSSKQYAAHINYGQALEAAGDPGAAIDQYRLALSLDGTRSEAYEALIRLDALPPPTPYACAADEEIAPPSDEPVDPALFIQVSGDQLVTAEGAYLVRGVNYYSRFAQWHHFLTDLDLETAAQELTLISQAGLNTIRIFLWYEPLFTCAPEDAVPVPATFARLDRLLELAQERGLKVIVTLNDLPDLLYRPLYTDYPRYDAQTAYIVRRYRNDPTILAWDLRNEGDLDYGARGDVALFLQETVIDWLAHTSQVVRDNDSNHLLTAGWWGDPTITAPYVDVLSFHHWSTPVQLAQRIETYRASNDRPLLLEEVGYYSWSDTPLSAATPQQQAESLAAAVNESEVQGISGWLVWTAFDFQPYDAQYHFEHFFGLWDVNLNPKPALDALPLP
jgi:hypothetical protein